MTLAIAQPHGPSDRVRAIHERVVFADVHAHPSRFHRSAVAQIEADEIARYKRGLIDLVARTIGERLNAAWGQSVIVDNRSGVGGNIAAAYVARAQPDGYTLMIMDSSTMIVPGLFKSLPFDVAKDFTPITEVFRAPEAFVVHPSVNASTMKEFVALAHASPG